MANNARAKKRDELRSDLLADLKNRGLTEAFFTDKVEEYMQLWDIAQYLQDDIEQRGVYLEYKHGANQSGTTENKSLASRVKVSSQMLSIWIALGFRDRAKDNGQSADDVDAL